MHSIYPSEDCIVGEKSVQLKQKLAETLAAWLYLLCTVGSSIYFLSILKDSVANDFWWSHFNTTGGQTFLADLFNSKLILDSYGALNLLDDASSNLKEYSSINTFVTIRPAAVRRLMLDTIPLDMAISTIRKNSLYENVYTIIAHCWVDFGRHFEMAHTATRQQRCNNQMQPDAAVYLESLLRNINTSDLGNSAFGMNINQTIFKPMLDIENGPVWLQQLFSHQTWLGVAEEANEWRRHGLQYYAFQFQNRFQYGIEDSLTIVNALGVHQNIKISSIPYIYRGLTVWTTAQLAVGLWNDLDICNFYGCSLVRNSNISLEAMGRDWDIEYTGQTYTIAANLTRQNIGPLMNQDIYYLQLLPELVAYFQSFEAELMRELKTNKNSRSTYLQIPAKVEVYAYPSAWQDPRFKFYSGSPLCLFFENPSTRPLTPFSYLDACQNQELFTILIQRNSALFGLGALPMMLMNNFVQVCNQTVVESSTCISDLARAIGLVQFSPSLRELAVKAALAVDTLNISYVQVATDNSNNQLWLTQSILSSTDISWSFLGWVALFDWVNGQREVCIFEGDTGRVTLMSNYATNLDFAANPLELPRKACFYFWYAVVYTTFLSFSLMVVVLFYGLRMKFIHIESSNLIQFNRVFGSVWIGRPLMFIRGMTAVVILSTSTATLTTQSHLVTFYQEPSRNLIDMTILTAETLWIAYVVNDIFMPWTQRYTKITARASTVLAFLITLGIELFRPVGASGSVQRQCTFTSFRRGLECTSGVIEIGSVRRVVVLIIVQVASCVMAYAVVRLYDAYTYVLDGPQALNRHHLLIPAAAEAYFVQTSDLSWRLDSVACAIAGMLSFRSFLFDLKIWTILFRKTPQRGFAFERVKFHVDYNSRSGGLAVVFRRRHALLGFVSLLYMAGSIAGCYSFLELTKSTMSNDFWWAHFDKDVHVFICNWFNRQLQLTNYSTDIDLASATYGAMATSTNRTPTFVTVAPLYANFIQNEANSLRNVIESLRNMDGCRVPWIMTSYCFADWKQRWEMAKSAKRQDRCYRDKENGAVYLEAVLQNANWDSLQNCWGEALEIGIGSVVQQTSEGKEWYKSIVSRSSVRSVSDEVAFWQSFGITRYTTQWQNYKSLGVIESFSIENAFGIDYPLTIKYSNSSLHIPVQTSFKMTWPLALDLILLSSGNSSSTISGTSLIRTSSNFAFANKSSTEQFLVANNCLNLPLGPGFELGQNLFGPFGTIDMERVPPPADLAKLFDDIGQNWTHVLSSDDVIQREFWAIYSSFTFEPRPNAWKYLSHRGGNFLCDLDPTAQSLDDRPAISFSSKGSCGTGLQETLTGDTVSLIRAIFAVENLNITATALQETFEPGAANFLLSNANSFLTAHFADQTLKQFQKQAIPVKTYIRDHLQVSTIQYVNPRFASPVNYELSVVNFFAHNEVDFEMFAWMYMFDWVQGIREVVRFQGDNGTITTMSTSTNFVEMPTNSMEVPFNVAYYMQILIQYITFVMLAVASVVCIYIVTLRGYIEAGNMTSFGRIAALVWIGRPLICLRALCAICVLSTSSMQLTRPLSGLVSYLVADPQPWYTVILASGELNWLVYIVNDVFSILTNHYTHGYSWTSFVLVWFTSALWEFIVPAKRSVSIVRTCIVDEVDAQLLCRGGTIYIGSFNRFCGLMTLVCGCCMVSLLFEWLRLRSKEATKMNSNSFFLYAAAKHQFHTAKWKYQDVYYLDKASAVLTGLLSFEYKNVVYLFDVKTWRLYEVPATSTRENSFHLPHHLMHAIPLLE